MVMEGLSGANFKRVWAGRMHQGCRIGGEDYYCVSKSNVYNELALPAAIGMNRPFERKAKLLIRYQSTGNRQAMTAGVCCLGQQS